MRCFFYPRTWPSQTVDFSPHPWIFLHEVDASIDEYLQRFMDEVLRLERINVSVEWHGPNIDISRITAACNLYHRAQHYVVRLSRPTQDLLLDSRPPVKKARLEQNSLFFFFLPSLLKASLSSEKRV